MPIDTINWIKIYIYKEIQFINRIIKGIYSKAYNVYKDVWVASTILKSQI